MSDQNISIAISTGFDPTGTNQAITAVKNFATTTDDSTRALDRAATGPIDTHAKKSAAAAGATKNWGMVSTAASYQMQDFAVQVGMGTSAVTAFSQQAPQMLGALSMAGVVSGPFALAITALAAAIPIVVAGYKMLPGAISETGEAAKNVADRMKKVSDDSNKLLAEDLQKRIQAIDREAEETAKLEQKWEKSKKSSNEYTTAVLENAEKYEKSQLKIAEALGLKLDKMEAIEKLEHIQEAKLALKAKQELEAEQQRTSDAIKAAGVAEQKAVAYQTEAARIQAELTATRAMRDKLLKEQHDQQMIVDKSPGILERMGPRAFDESPGSPKARQFEADAARKKVENPINVGNIEFVRSRVETLETALKELTGEGGKVHAMGVAAEAAANIAEDAKQSYATKSAEINERLNQATADLKADNALEKSKLIADEIKTLTGGLVTANDGVKANIQELNKRADDGKVVATELDASTRATSALIGQVQVGLLTSTKQTQAELLAMLVELKRNQDQLASQVAGLKSQMSMPRPR